VHDAEGRTVFSEEGDQTLSESVGEDQLGADDENLSSARSRSELTLGVNPLKKLPTPSCLTMLRMMDMPPSLLSKLAFCIRVLTTSRGAATVMEATAPAMDATKSASQHTPVMLRTLAPCGRGVIRDFEEVLLGCSGSTEKLS
jgi:hypothetical protein